MTEQLRVYVLGEFRLYRDGRLVSPKDWHTSQARQLFKLLLTERGKTVSAQRLADLLWSEEYADNAHKTLRSAMSALRDVLEPDRQPQALSRFLPRGQGGYRLLLPTDGTLWIDAAEFESLLNLAERDSERRERLLVEALQFHRPLPRRTSPGEKAEHRRRRITHTTQSTSERWRICRSPAAEFHVTDEAVSGLVDG